MRSGRVPCLPLLSRATSTVTLSLTHSHSHTLLLTRTSSLRIRKINQSKMHASPAPTINPSSPRRFAFPIILSLLALSLLFYTNRCMAPNRSCTGVFYRDFMFSKNMQMHWPNQGGASTDADTDAFDLDDDSTTTTNTTTNTNKDNNKNNNNTTSTQPPLTKTLAVPDLYQYALTSPRFRTDKDAGRLRRYLRSRASGM